MSAPPLKIRAGWPASCRRVVLAALAVVDEIGCGDATSRVQVERAGVNVEPWTALIHPSLISQQRPTHSPRAGQARWRNRRRGARACRRCPAPACCAASVRRRARRRRCPAPLALRGRRPCAPRSRRLLRHLARRPPLLAIVCRKVPCTARPEAARPAYPRRPASPRRPACRPCTACRSPRRRSTGGSRGSRRPRRGRALDLWQRVDRLGTFHLD